MNVKFDAIEGSYDFMTLTKNHIIDSIQESLGFSRNRSAEVTETLLELIKRTMEDGDHLMISGFGKFNVKDKKSRRGRNPATGDDMMLAPRKVVTFVCSGKLRDKINNS
jgi:integration host factor subunit alpha